MNPFQHPADRPTSEAVAFTIKEGGIWLKGPPEAGFHTVLYPDGWAFDMSLQAHGVNRGARHVPFPPVFDENDISLPVAVSVDQFRPPRDEDKSPRLLIDTIRSYLDDLEYLLGYEDPP